MRVLKERGIKGKKERKLCRCNRRGIQMKLKERKGGRREGRKEVIDECTERKEGLQRDG